MTTHILAIANQKGGVGKTAIAFNLARTLARSKKRILCIDNDTQGNLTLGLLGKKPEIKSPAEQLFKDGVTNLSIQEVDRNLWLFGTHPNDQGLALASMEQGGPTNFKKIVQSIAAKGTFDFIIIDTNPYVSNLTIASLAAASLVLIPMEASGNALAGVTCLLQELKKLKQEGHSTAKWLGFIVNKLRNTNYQQDYFKLLKDRFPADVFKTALSSLTAFEESPERRVGVIEYEPEGNAAHQMKLFVKEFLARVKALTEPEDK